MGRLSEYSEEDQAAINGAGTVPRVQINITIECLPGDRIGFGCSGEGSGELTDEALDLLSALQDTINRFAHVNGMESFDCTKPSSGTS